MTVTPKCISKSRGSTMKYNWVDGTKDRKNQSFLLEDINEMSDEVVGKCQEKSIQCK